MPTVGTSSPKMPRQLLPSHLPAWGARHPLTTSVQGERKHVFSHLTKICLSLLLSLSLTRRVSFIFLGLLDNRLISSTFSVNLWCGFIYR